MTIETKLYNLKIKVLNGSHISDTLKKEIADEINKIEKLALKQSENVVLDGVSNCAKCDEPVYDFGLCMKHYCISEMDTTHGC